MSSREETNHSDKSTLIGQNKLTKQRVAPSRSSTCGHKDASSPVQQRVSEQIRLQATAHAINSIVGPSGGAPVPLPVLNTLPWRTTGKDIGCCWANSNIENNCPTTHMVGTTSTHQQITATYVYVLMESKALLLLPSTRHPHMPIPAHKRPLLMPPPCLWIGQKLLQSVVGTLLYYCRAVDPSIRTAVHQLGSVQSNPTETDMANMERLLQYVSTHQNNGIRYYASNMILQLMSDASYLCSSTSYLGSPDAINGPISCGSRMISCVCASVLEAELAGGFQAAQTATHHRRILSDLGYPQPATMLRMNNTIALVKRSKSMDMRFFWLVDRVEQQQFVVSHIAGIWNIADHFKKPLPKNKFDQFFHFLVVNMDNEPKTTKQKTVTVTVSKRNVTKGSVVQIL